MAPENNRTEFYYIQKFKRFDCRSRNKPPPFSQKKAPEDTKIYSLRGYDPSTPRVNTFCY
jgi:phosphatidylethanolamine-binding protein (PEBP) family uncharacterized protein